MNKIKVGIIGTGNIGTDLLKKILQSPLLECGIFMGRNVDSKGIEIANTLSIPVAYNSIQALQDNPSLCDIVFDATSANTHKLHAPILKKLGKFTIDLTPAKIGGFCVPALNLHKALEYDNINLVTCGGQATIPLAYALLSEAPNIEYIETVSTIASKSAGIGTRDNIDEFIQTTKDALSYFTGISQTKSIILVNPAEPPINMKNTIYAILKNPNMVKIQEAVNNMVSKIKEYVPGYNVILDPIYDGHKIMMSIEVLGKGDFLPTYAGNLDIITCAAIRVAEAYAKKRGLK